MKKLAYLFVMIAGMTLASVNVNAQDAKTAVKKEASACCKGGDQASCCKKGAKETASTASNKDANVNKDAKCDKVAACTKSKSVTTASDAKSTKTVN